MNKVKLICSECHKDFELYPSQVYYQQLHRKISEWFCTKKCYGKWLGKYHGWGKGKHTKNSTINFKPIEIPDTIGSHRKTHQWLQKHAKEVVEYSLTHTQKQTAIHFQIYPQSVYSAKYMCGYKVPKSYLIRCSK